MCFLCCMVSILKYYLLQLEGANWITGASQSSFQELNRPLANTDGSSFGWSKEQITVHKINIKGQIPNVNLIHIHSGINRSNVKINRHSMTAVSHDHYLLSKAISPIRCLSFCVILVQCKIHIMYTNSNKIWHNNYFLSIILFHINNNFLITEVLIELLGYQFIT